MERDKMSRATLVVTIEAKGKQLVKDALIPLVISKTRPNRYDLLASLHAVPALKNYKFSRVRPVETLLFESRGNLIDAASDDNFLSKLEVEKMQTAYAKAEGLSRGKVYELQLDDELKTYKCAMCPCDALHADVRLNVPFCSQACWESFV